MIVRIRQFCCALTTFVRLVSVFFLVFHILLAIAATIWYSLRHLQFTKNQETAENNGALPSGEVDDRTFDTFLIGSENESNKDSKSPEENPHFDLIIGEFWRENSNIHFRQMRLLEQFSNSVLVVTYCRPICKLKGVKSSFCYSAL